jgi:hypothetical protein
LRIDIAVYVSCVRHPALSHDQQTRLAMAWPTIYLTGNGMGCDEDVWRGALGYSRQDWEESRERFALVLDKGGVWMVDFLRCEVERQREQSKKQSERVSKRWNTTVQSGIPGDTSEYPTSASKEPKETTSGLWLCAEGGERWVPSVTQVSDWKVANPGVDVETEFAKMRGWLEANPTKAKTLRGMPRFANGWMQRAVASAKPQAQVPENDGVWGLVPKRGR